jgi:hypothetical protein
MKLPQYIQDIRSNVDAVPYGESTFKVKRHKNKVYELDVILEETLAYHGDNQRALQDILTMIATLADNKANTVLNFSIALKEGMIQTIGYVSTTKATYNEKGKQ